MADFGYRRKLRRNSVDGKKLLVGEKVEVKSAEDGFAGSWHAGEVIDCSHRVRTVRYNELLDDDGYKHLTEEVEVSSFVDGNSSSSERAKESQGKIRPFPPFRELKREEIHYGLCVDAYYDVAWWEGVVFDREDGSDTRSVFFPDLGDELTFEIKDLRVTHLWDEVTAEWKPRGNWLLLEILEEYEMDNFVPASIKQIWYDVRSRKEFSEVGAWASSLKPLWQNPIVEIMKEYSELIIDGFVSSSGLSEALCENGEPICTHDSALTLKPNSGYSQPVIPPEDRELQDGKWMTENEEAIKGVNKLVANDELVMDSRDASPSSIAVTPFNDQVVSEQPKALAVISSDSKKRLPRKRKSRNDPDSEEHWQYAHSILKIAPEFCPRAIDEYLLSRRPGNIITRNARNHLCFLGWTMHLSTRNDIKRFRYTSPEGKRVYSLREVCTDIEKPVPERSSLTIEDTQKRILPSPDNLISLPLDKEQQLNCEQTGTRKRKRKPAVSKFCDFAVGSVKPEYCPHAVTDYLKFFNPRTNRGRTDLLFKAKRHLAAIGWTFWFKRKKKGNDEWRYDPPTKNKTYNSLRSACTAIAKGVESNTYSSSSIPKDDGVCSEELKGHSGGELSLPNAEPQRDSFSQKPKKCSMLMNHRGRGIRNLHKRKKNGLGRYWSLRHRKQQDKLLEYDEDTNELKNEEKQHSVRKLKISFSSKKRKPLGKGRRSSNGNNLTPVLRLSKRVRQTGLSTSSQVSRTVLSWLIDNNEDLGRSKVYYCRKRGSSPLREGRISRDGIKCSCCQTVFTLSSFEVHAGSNCRRPAANLYLEDGRSLVECQMQMLRQNSRSFSKEPLERARGNLHQSWNDHVCSICHYGGKLILCDQCPSSFHADCLNLQKIPEGDWFCPSCCCGICGESQFDVNTEQLSDKSLLCCHQCERQYHAHCIRDREMIKLDVFPTENWFCCKKCEKVHWGLQQLLGKPILVGHNLTWTLIKPMNYEASDQDDCDIETMADNYSKLNVALEVMHECFEPVKEPQTGRDLVEDVIFCRSSRLNRLNFKGFYTVLLERNDELITVAILRVYGSTVAEIPLVGTRFHHRRLGMCRILMNEIEKNLLELGVNKLVLPAAASVLSTWTTAFGFSQVTQSERAELLGFTFLEFQDTIMCQKLLRKLPSSLSRLLRDVPGIQSQPRQNTGGNANLDFEGNSGISEVVQVEGSEIVDQGAQVTGSADKRNGGYDGLACVLPMVTDTTNGESETCKTLDLSDQTKVDRDKSDGNLKFYKRKKAKEIRPSISQADYPKVEVSCR